MTSKQRRATIIIIGAAILAWSLLALSTCAKAQDDRYPHQTAHSVPAVHQVRAVASHGDCSVVDSYARAAGVPVHIARAVIRHESGCNPRARNKSGAAGMGQLMPRTARGLGYRGSPAGLLDPAVNLPLSMRYLAMAIARGGQGCAGIGLYERGIAARPVCTAYGRAVLARAS